MLLAIDIGNTNVVFGLFQHANLAAHVRCESSRTKTADEYAVFLQQAFALRHIDCTNIRAAIIASVVPSLTDTMVAMVSHAFALDAIVVGTQAQAGIEAGMPILVDHPQEVGTDRIVNAVAAYDAVHSGLIVVDFGTATTFDCVSPDGAFLGGAIVPGIQTSAEALFARTAKLARVKLAIPPTVLGRNTHHAMQSGISFGYASLVDGMVERLRDELGFPCTVWATGGLANLFAKLSKTIDHVDENLTLHGIRIAYEHHLRA